MSKTMQGQQADWTILDEPGVMEIAERAARHVASEYSTTLYSLTDLEQEAYLLLASGGDHFRECVSEGSEGLLYHRLSQRLYNRVRTELAHSNASTSLEPILLEGAAAHDQGRDFDAW